MQLINYHNFLVKIKLFKFQSIYKLADQLFNISLKKIFIKILMLIHPNLQKIYNSGFLYYIFTILAVTNLFLKILRKKNLF
jgi:hypothetical protein